jgi:cell division GTPase FtsZ
LVNVEAAYLVGEVIFDIRQVKSHIKHAFEAGSEPSLYQNLTIDDAKELRKALKKAIQEIEGK